MGWAILSWIASSACGLLAMTTGACGVIAGAVRQAGWRTFSWIASSACGLLAMTGGFPGEGGVVVASSH
jgi:hypothetical protein